MLVSNGYFIPFFTAKRGEYSINGCIEFNASKNVINLGKLIDYNSKKFTKN